MAYLFYNAMSNVRKSAEFKILQKDCFLSLPLGERIDREKHWQRVPDRIQQTDRKPLHDTISLLINVMIATKAVTDIIERFEPGVHQFVPLEVRNKKGEPVGADYFIIQPLQVFCAILGDDEAPYELRWKFKNVYGPMPAIARYSAYRPILSKPKIAGRHLWRSEVINNDETYLSDELARAIMAETNHNWRLEKVKEVDRPWIAQRNILPFIMRQPGFPADDPRNMLREP